MSIPTYPGVADWAEFRARMILIEMFGERILDGGASIVIGRARELSYEDVNTLVRTVAAHLRATALNGPCLPSCNHPIPMRKRPDDGEIIWCSVCGAWADAAPMDAGRVAEIDVVWNVPLGRVILPESS